MKTFATKFLYIRNKKKIENNCFSILEHVCMISTKNDKKVFCLKCTPKGAIRLALNLLSNQFYVVLHITYMKLENHKGLISPRDIILYLMN